ncbi:hypothetical protein JOD82_004776 [Paenibacillus sp. 1182]|nr:hypothetical protein [Paenibacillus sp. 1182]
MNYEKDVFNVYVPPLKKNLLYRSHHPLFFQR